MKFFYNRICNIFCYSLLILLETIYVFLYNFILIVSLQFYDDAFNKLIIENYIYESVNIQIKFSVFRRTS